MQCNVGTAEKVVRVIIGLAILSLLYFLEGNLRYLGLIGLIPILTAVVSWCPINALVGINTCKGRSAAP